jgi:hypothetical protein
MKFACSSFNSPGQKASTTAAFKPNALPKGQHPGFGKLKTQPGVFRGKLRAVAAKRDANHADYEGAIFLDGGRKAGVRLWVHADGSLGLRIALLKQRREQQP